ncbi:MAG: acyl carrier protein [Magnetococcales bacterium]|nr:acyl carrier protein [Magnetococcales bacterium]
MSSSDKIKSVIKVFLTQLNPDRDLSALLDQDNLLEAGLMTSMDFMSLIQTMEDETGKEIDLSDVDPASLTTIAGLDNYFSQ